MRAIFLLSTLFFLFYHPIKSQNDCDNIDFEAGTFSTWTGFTGTAGYPIVTLGLSSGRHEIISQQGLDILTNNVVFRRSPFGGSFSCKLGNSESGGNAESLSRQFDVTAENNSILLSYAVVFEDPGHEPEEQPKFRMEIFEANGQIIDNPCFYYSVTASNDLPGFVNATDEVLYRDWTPVAVDLTPYIGQTVTIKFSTEDCTLGGHFGYAYFDAKCGNLEISAYSCSGEGLVLSVPNGFINYAWSTGDTTSFIEVVAPVSGQQYTVVASTEAGCEVELFYTYNDSTIGPPNSEISSGFCSSPTAGFFTAPFGFDQYTWSNGTAGYQAFYSALVTGDTIFVELSGGPFCDTTLQFIVPFIEEVAVESEYISTTICGSPISQEFTAPGGFDTYIWGDNTTNLTFILQNPTLGDSAVLFATLAQNCPQRFVYIIDNQIA